MGCADRSANYDEEYRGEVGEELADGSTEEDVAEEINEELAEEIDDPLDFLEEISYVRTLADTEIFDVNANVLGIIGENQVFVVDSVADDGLLKLGDLPFYVSYDQIEIAEELEITEAIDLDLSRYLPFEQMLAESSAVNFYHLDHTFAFRLDAIDTDINIYMQEADYFYANYLDTYFLVNQDDVTLIDNPDSLPEADHVAVLMYHYFCNSADEVECQNNNWIERDHFEEHIQYLYENDFTTLKMIDIERFLNGDVRLPVQSVAITIDDAHPTAFEYAYPILVEYNQIATVFAITHMDRDWETFLLSDNLELHSHTHDMHRGHCDAGQGGVMQCIDFDEGVADLNMSISILEGTTAFAYPYGDFNDHAIAMLEEANFTLAFTTQNGLVARGMEPLALPRVRVSTDTHLVGFSYLVRQ